MQGCQHHGMVGHAWFLCPYSLDVKHCSHTSSVVLRPFTVIILILRPESVLEHEVMKTPSQSTFNSAKARQTQVSLIDIGQVHFKPPRWPDLLLIRDHVLPLPPSWRCRCLQCLPLGRPSRSGPQRDEETTFQPSILANLVERRFRKRMFSWQCVWKRRLPRNARHLAGNGDEYLTPEPRPLEEFQPYATESLS